MKKRAVVTISALNYAARAEIVCRSFKKFHPKIPFHFFVMDDHDGSRTKKAGFKSQAQLHFMNEFARYYEKQPGRPSLMSMLFPYDVMEASTAIKPFVLMMMFEELGYDEVLFIDPDTMFVDSMDSVWNAFSEGDVLLTPHLVTFGDEEEARLGEKAVLQSGIFNLGFLGVANKPKVREFLNWWGRRLVRYCLKDPGRGYFTDQRWVDPAFGAMTRSVVLRDPGLNVAHWNIHERKVWRDKGGTYRVGKETLKFFHFSGYKPTKPDKLSGYRPDLKLAELGAVKSLAAEYHKMLAKLGNSKLEKVDYGYEKFSNGIDIPPIIKWWARDAVLPERFTNPYEARDRNSFFNWLLRSSGTDLCPLASIVKNIRPDLQKSYPINDAKSNAAYMRWFLDRGVLDHEIDPKMAKLLEKKMPVYQGLLD